MPIDVPPGFRNWMISKVSIAAMIFLATAQAYGQSPPPLARPLTCGDFQRNPNGSWSPRVGVTINGISMGPGVAFNRGVAIGGIDVAALLDQKCRTAAPDTPLKDQ